MKHQNNNLFDGIPDTLQEELFETLADSDFGRIERIVSDGHATPPGEWYNQGWDEWVLLISGEAVLMYDDDYETTLQILKPGDHVLIPAGRRHRVEQTVSGEKTIWLAVHFRGRGVK